MTASNSLFAKFVPQEPTQTLRYETTEDARIRSILLRQGESNEWIDQMLVNYHAVQRVRQQLYSNNSNQKEN